MDVPNGLGNDKGEGRAGLTAAATCSLTILRMSFILIPRLAAADDTGGGPTALVEALDDVPDDPERNLS